MQTAKAQTGYIGRLMDITYALRTNFCFVRHMLYVLKMIASMREISVYLVKKKVVSTTSELILYHFTSD